MYNLHVERHLIDKFPSRDLAHHIYTYIDQGKAVVVTDKPISLLSATKKQWARLIRQVERERSSTLNPAKITQLTRQLARMNGLRFSAKPPNDLLEADITFATAERLVRFPPACPVVYVTYKFEKEKLYMLTSWMPKGGRVVVYEQS